MVGNAEQADASSLLAAWQGCNNPAQASVLLNQLFEKYVQPWLAEIAFRGVHSLGDREGDLEDQAAEIRAEVALGLTAQLATIREKNLPPIRDLRAYLSSAIYNASFMRLRARTPRRAQLHNRLRYLLRTDARYALWQSDHGWLAGLAQWSGRTRTAPTPALQFAPANLADFVDQVFSEAAAPVTWKSLTALAAELNGINDRPVRFSAPAYQLAAPERKLDAEIDGRSRLARIWTEVPCLPVTQRAALLLNLRDCSGQGVLELLPATGVASFAEVANALAMTPAQLARIWNVLPLEDSEIARHLDITQQQVINLRKSARARILRRITGCRPRHQHNK